MTLGENIKKSRLEKNLTQEALAGTVGVSAQAVSKWECGDSIPDGALFVPLADALGVSLDRLFGREAVYETDLYSALFRLISAAPCQKQMEKVREICWQTEKGLFGEDAENYRYDPGELSRLGASSSVADDTGFTYISNRRELPFFTVFPEPENGFRGALCYDEAYREMFEALSDTSTLKAFFKLFEKPLDFTFEAEVLAAECGIESESIEKTMGNLVRLRAVYSVDITLNGEKRRLYTVNQRYEWIAILALLNEFVYHCKSYNFQSCSRKKPYLGAK